MRHRSCIPASGGRRGLTSNKPCLCWIPNHTSKWHGLGTLDTLIRRAIRRLEQALRAYITESLRIQVTTFDDSLCEKIGDMEKAYNKSREGLWYRLWYGMGDATETSKAWLDLIPDSYGMAVAKTGVAVVFKVGCLLPAVVVWPSM